MYWSLAVDSNEVRSITLPGVLIWHPPGSFFERWSLINIAPHLRFCNRLTNYSAAQKRVRYFEAPASIIKTKNRTVQNLSSSRTQPCRCVLKSMIVLEAECALSHVLAKAVAHIMILLVCLNIAGSAGPRHVTIHPYRLNLWSSRPPPPSSVPSHVQVDVQR